jgi:spoIIIJ-associated protein
MDLGSFDISESTDGELIVVEIKGEAARELTSGSGRTVDALQLIANQASARIHPERRRVVLEVEGNTEAREEFLTKLASRVASRALETGRPVALDPMNSHDRRAIHVALRDRDDVATISEGSGRFRQVVVVPEGSDEFEDACEQSDHANQS